MSQNVPGTNEDHKSVLSKYAAKVRAREEGTRAPFQFVDSKQPSPPTTAPTPIVEVSKAIATPSFAPEQNEERVVAQVMKVCFHAKLLCAFLITADSRTVYMGGNKMKQWLKRTDHSFRRGDVVECTLQPHEKGLRVSKILSVTPFAKASV